ncbi:hypothetical protein RI367_006277 [Sorochytrium milnesiophthora]
MNTSVSLPNITATTTGLAPTPLIPNPDQVNKTALATKQMWCTSQTSICSNVCNNQFNLGGNVCSPSTLQYTCTCSDGRTPITDADVDLTMPYFACTYYFLTPCLNKCGPANQPCVDTCNTKYVCGHVKANPNATTTTTTTTSDAAASTNSPTAVPLPNVIFNNGAQSVSFGAWTLISAAGAVAVAML